MPWPHPDPAHPLNPARWDGPAALTPSDIEAASAFNGRAAGNSVHSLGKLHPKGHQCPWTSYMCPVLPSSFKHSAPLQWWDSSSTVPGPSQWSTSRIQPLASHGHPSPITVAATGRSGWSWLEPRLR